MQFIRIQKKNHNWDILQYHYNLDEIGNIYMFKQAQLIANKERKKPKN